MSDLRDRVERLEKSAADLRDFDVNAAWSAIEKGAAKLVQKSGESVEQRLDRFMRTPRGMELKRRYQAAFADRLQGVEKSQQNTGRRHAAEMAASRIVELVEKCSDAGLDAQATYQWIADSHPGLLEAFGAAPPTPVAKAGDDAMAEIERLAGRLVAKDGALSRAQAISEVLETAEGRRLYGDYLREAAGGSPEPRSQAARSRVEKSAGPGLYVEIDLDDGWGDE